MLKSLSPQMFRTFPLTGYMAPFCSPSPIMDFVTVKLQTW